MPMGDPRDCDLCHAVKCRACAVARIQGDSIPPLKLAKGRSARFGRHVPAHIHHPLSGDDRKVQAKGVQCVCTMP